MFLARNDPRLDHRNALYQRPRACSLTGLYFNELRLFVLPSRRMRSFRWAVAFLCLATTLASAAEPKDPLARARLLYNDRQFDAAVAAAEEARRAPERADS